MSPRFRCLGEPPATQSIRSFLKGQAPHRVPTGRTYQVLFYFSRVAQPPVRRTGLHPQTPAVSDYIAQTQLAKCE